MPDGDAVVVRGSWVIRAPRERVYAIVSDFERMPEHFPKVARSITVTEREGDRLAIEATAASFGRFFPEAKTEMTVELLPGRGYRCTTHNITFNTTGDEQLLLEDDPEGTRVEYTYHVTVRNRRMKPAYQWLTNTFAVPYWKRSFLDRLEPLVAEK